MRRRDFVTLFGSLVACPLKVRAQQPATPVIGFLSGASPETMRALVAAFHRGLADTGFAEGRNLTIEYRWAEGNNDRLPALAMDLARRKVAAIDMCAAKCDVRFTPNSNHESRHPHTVMSALPPKADMCSAHTDVC